MVFSGIAHLVSPLRYTKSILSLEIDNAAASLNLAGDVSCRDVCTTNMTATEEGVRGLSAGGTTNIDEGTDVLCTITITFSRFFSPLSTVLLLLCMYYVLLVYYY